jgi:hypothetical protein
MRPIASPRGGRFEEIFAGVVLPAARASTARFGCSFALTILRERVDETEKGLRVRDGVQQVDV